MQPNEYDQQMLDLFVDNIKADRTDLDLLFGAMLAWGRTALAAYDDGRS